MPPVFLCHAGGSGIPPARSAGANLLALLCVENKAVGKFIGKKPIKYLQIAILCIIFASDFQEKHTNQNRELCLSTKS